MAVTAVLLYVGSDALDRTLAAADPGALRWIYTGGPEGAREVLSTVAGSMITVAGVVFSITIVVLVLASQQFGPRILSHFMRDRGNQVVLGVFIATFLYCLLALRSVRGREEFEFVPQFSVTVGIGLGLVSLGVLIYFIHHTATSIQAPRVVQRVARDLERAIERTFPEEPEEGPSVPAGGEPGDPGGRGNPIRARKSGYLQLLDEEGLLTLAREEDLVLEVVCRPGDFLVEGATVARVRPAGPMRESEQREELADRVNRTLIYGSARTETQDPDFVVQQMAEIAVRALSPSMNDPFTAVNCVDALGAALVGVAARPPLPARRHDEEGELRLLLDPVAFPRLLDSAFDQIRFHASRSPGVLVRLLESIAALATHAGRDEDRRALLRHAEKVRRAAREGLFDEADLRSVHAEYERTSRALETGPAEGAANPSC